MEQKKSIWKKICIALIILTSLPIILFAGCIIEAHINPEAWGRYSQYSEQEILKILEMEYNKEFSILSCDDIDSGFHYTIGLKEIPDLTFSFYDVSDGFAGWFAHDNFGDAVLVYTAKKCDLKATTEHEGCSYPVIYSEDKSINEFSEKLEITFEMYFKIFDYCKGDIIRYSSYNPEHENFNTHFCITEYETDFEPNSPECVVYDNGFDGYIPPWSFCKGIKGSEIRTVISKDSNPWFTT